MLVTLAIDGTHHPREQARDLRLDPEELVARCCRRSIYGIIWDISLDEARPGVPDSTREDGLKEERAVGEAYI